MTRKKSSVSNKTRYSTSHRKVIRKIRIGEVTEKDKTILIYFGEGGAALAALKLGKDVQYVYQRIHRLKKKVERWTNALSIVNALKLKYPRVRKSLMVIHQETWEKQ